MKRAQLFLGLLLFGALTATGLSAQNSITTTFASNNSAYGNMFDVTVSASIAITELDVNLSGNEGIQLWWKPGTYVGSEGNQAAWTLHETVSGVVSAGTNNPTRVTFGTPLVLTGGQTYGLYVATTGTSSFLNYTDGANTYVSGDGIVTIQTGVGKDFPIFSGTFSPRTWNGTIHYLLASPGPAIYVKEGSFVQNGGNLQSTAVQLQGVNNDLQLTIFNGSAQNSLTVSTIAAPTNQTNCTATVTQQPASSISPLGASTFVVQVNPTAQIFSFDLSISSNDADDNPFTFTYVGLATGTAGGLDVTANANGATAIPEGEVDRLVNRFRLSTPAGSDTVTDIELTNNGTIADGDITDVKLWHDVNDNGILDGTDVQIGTPQTFTAGVATFSGLSLVVPNASIRLLVTTTLAVGATGDVQFDLTDVTATNTATGLPANGNTHTVQAIELAVTAQGGSPNPVAGSSDSQVGVFTLTALSGTHTVTDIEITQNGSVLDADITELKLFEDTDGSGDFNTGDVQLGTTQTLTAGVATFSGLTLNVAFGTPVRIFTTVTLSTAATGTNQFSITAVTATPGPVTGIPSVGQSRNIQIVQLTVNSQNANGPGPIAGTNDNYVGRYRLVNSGIDQTVTEIEFTQTGTVLEADVVDIKIYEDTDGDGHYTVGDVQLGGTMTQSGGVVTFTGLNIVVTTGTTVRVNLTTSLSATATGSTGYNITSVTAAPGPVVNIPTPVRNRNITDVAVNLGAPGVSNNPGQGESDQHVSTFTMDAQAGNHVVGMIEVTLTGTVLVADVLDVKLFADTDDSGDFNAGDVQIGSTATLAGAIANFSGLAVAVDAGTPVRFFVTASLTPAATGTIGFDFTGISVASGPANTIPVVGAVRTIATPALNVAPVGLFKAFTVPSSDSVVSTHVFTSDAGTQTISDIEVTQSGTILDADVTEVKLFEDTDASGTFNAGDTQIGTTQTLTAGVATFSGLTVAVNYSAASTVFVTVSVAGTATGTAGFDVTSVTSAPGPVNGLPSTGSIQVSVVPVSAFPFGDGFEQPVTNRVVQTSGRFPAGNNPVTWATYNNAGTVEFGATTSAQAPFQGSGQAGIHFPPSGTEKAGAIDYHFDMSAFDANNDTVMLEFVHADRGDENDPEDGVFISLDGGASWALRLLHLIDGSFGYSARSIDISAALVAESLNFTSNVVIRFQGQDNFQFGSDGHLFDNIKIGTALDFSEIDVSFGGSTVANGGNVSVDIADTGTTSYTFTITNTGTAPLNLTGTPLVATALGTNVASATVTTPPTSPVAVGASTTFTIEIAPNAAAPATFDFDVTIESDDLFNTHPYTFTVDGNIVTNVAPMVSVPTGSNWVDAGGGLYTLTVGIGDSINDALDASDITPDTMSLTVTAPVTPFTGLTTEPMTAAAASGPLSLSFVGMVDVVNMLGDYEWDIDIDDGTTVVSITARISVVNASPVAAILDATGGDGSQANPFTVSYDPGATLADQVDIFTMSDADMDVLTLFATPNQTSGPTSGVTGFYFLFDGTTVSVVPYGMLLDSDAGTYVFRVRITDGNTTTNVFVSIEVTTPSTPGGGGGGGGGSSDDGGCAASTSGSQTTLWLLLLAVPALALLRRKRSA